MRVSLQPLTVDFTRVDVAGEVYAEEFEPRSDVCIVLGNEVHNPGLLLFQVADTNPFFPPKVAPPGGRGAGSWCARKAVGCVEDVVTVDEEPAWFTVLRSDVEEIAVRVEDLDPAVAAVGDVDSAPGVELDVVRITESTRLSALCTDTTTHFEYERSVT